jgi:RimJ/RimL family protein N-acetyltransferase
MLTAHDAAAVIGTPRLELTPLREADSTELAVVLGDERLHEFIGGRPLGRDELRDRFRALAAGSGRADELWLNWIIRLRPTGEAAGTVQATMTVTSTGQAASSGTDTVLAASSGTGTELAASVAWVVGTAWQGRGFAAESAIALVAWLRAGGVRTITACIHPLHHASERVAERAGLTQTDDEVDGERVWVLRPVPVS